jgi:hypothetical protein
MGGKEPNARDSEVVVRGFMACPGNSVYRVTN